MAILAGVAIFVLTQRHHEPATADQVVDPRT
jgi:hypothetical protein